jgi:hypothetical protein
MYKVNECRKEGPGGGVSVRLSVRHNSETRKDLNVMRRCLQH